MKWADAPESIRDTVDNILAMLDEGRWTLPGQEPGPEQPTPILRTSHGRFAREGELIAVLGDVLIRFFPPPEYPTYIVLMDLLWMD